MTDVVSAGPSATNAAPILQRVAERAKAPLVANALVLMGNSGVIAGLGFVFWTLAARLYPAAEVGLASAAISAAVFMATVAMFGLPYALVRFSPTAGQDRVALTSTALFVVTIAGAAGGAILVAGIGAWAPALSGLAPPLVLAAVIVPLAAATGATGMLVYVAVSTRDARPALAGGLTQGVVKCALVILFAVAFPRLGMALVAIWLFGAAGAVLLEVWLLRAHLSRIVDLRLLRLDFIRYSAGNYAGDLAWSAPGLLFPLLVVAGLGPEANAYFYVAWAITSLLVAIPDAVASSLLAEGSHAPSDTDEHVSRAFGLVLAVVLPAIGLCWIAAPLLLGLFGVDYAANGIDTLRILSLAALPVSLNILYLTVARVERAVSRILGIAVATGGGALFAGAALAPSYGAEGIALGYLVVHAAVAVFLTSRWWLRRVTRRSREHR